MQRLDDQFLMRPSEAPHLKRLPSEYMRDHCWYTTQPMEANNLKALECTLDMIKADTQLLYASDWPHFDFRRARPPRPSSAAGAPPAFAGVWMLRMKSEMRGAISERKREPLNTP